MTVVVRMAEPLVQEAEVLARGIAEALARVERLEERVSHLEDENTALRNWINYEREQERDIAAAQRLAADVCERKARVAP